MLSNDLQKLKSSLNDAIENWMLSCAEKDKEWNTLGTSTSDNVCELMTDSAFNILLAQRDLTEYYRNDGQLE